MNAVLNVWGTDINYIDPDEFCIWCEHTIGGHYTNCNRSDVSLVKLYVQFEVEYKRSLDLIEASFCDHVELAGATLKYTRGRTFGKLEGMAPLREVYK